VSDDPKPLWDVPSSWAWATMADIGTVASGGTPRTDDERSFGGDIAWLTPSDLTGFSGKSIAGGMRTLSAKGLAASSAALLPPGTVLFSSRAPIGYVAIAAGPLATNQGFKSLIAHAEVFNEYVYYYLKGSKSIAARFASGTTFLEVSKSRFSRIPVPVAPLREQQRIVAKIEELFSQLDAGVAALHKAKAQLQRYRQAVLKAAMSGELTREWRAAHKDELEPASVLLERILRERRAKWEAEQLEKMKAGARVPKGDAWKREHRGPAKPNHCSLATLPPMWAWATIDWVAELVSGQHILKKHYDANPGGLPYLTGPADFGDKHPTVSKWTNKPKAMAKKGDVLITVKGAGVGKSNMLDLDEAAISRQLMSVRAKEVNPNFMFWFLKSALSLLHELGAGSTVPGIDRESILGVCVPIPPVQEQTQVVSGIERRLSTAEGAQVTIDETLRRSARLRQSILKRAFEGKLVPQDPTDEPASVLLERIKAEKASRPAARKAGAKTRRQDTPQQRELF
jgi:type I restriction enzyme S subunit